MLNLGVNSGENMRIIKFTYIYILLLNITFHEAAPRGTREKLVGGMANNYLKSNDTLSWVFLVFILIIGLCISLVHCLECFKAGVL